VDDNRDAASSLTMLLELLGNKVRCAYDGEDAVHAAAEFRPDAILLDIGLPRLNGYEACRRIRAQRPGKDIPIIAITGWGQDEDRRRSREAGFDRHLTKPVDPEALMTLLAGLQASRSPPPH
jgi:CheY-like chemotaxis protein